MYAGREVESGKTQTLLQNPFHPYTRGILDSLPDTTSGEKALKSIAGFPPELGKQPTGCAFTERCPYAQADCSVIKINPTLRSDGHRYFCPVNPLADSMVRA
jgi:oligopeptide/dipeptide ABC transporter ATP-binding protein